MTAMTQTNSDVPTLSAATKEIIKAFYGRPVKTTQNIQLAAAFRAAAIYCKHDRIRLLALAEELEQ